MSKSFTRRVIIVESRKILAHSLQHILSGLEPDEKWPKVASGSGSLHGEATTSHSGPSPSGSWQIRATGVVEEALQFAFEPPEAGGSEQKSPVFLLGGTSYWEMIDSGKRVRACFPDARIVILDDQPRLGASLVAEQLSIQGYASQWDSVEDFMGCVWCVVGDGLYISPHGQEYLDAGLDSAPKPNGSRHELRCRAVLRKNVPFTFSERELHCFRLLLTAQECAAIVAEFGMQSRSARNLKYRLMRRMGVKHFVDALRLAHSWGLLDI